MIYEKWWFKKKKKLMMWLDVIGWSKMEGQHLTPLLNLFSLSQFFFFLNSKCYNGFFRQNLKNVTMEQRNLNLKYFLLETSRNMS